MINVSQKVKDLFNSDSIPKNLYISIPSLREKVFTNEEIYSESMSLKESVLSDKVEFIGCVSSSFSITIRQDDENLKESLLAGYKIEAIMKVCEYVKDEHDEWTIQEVDEPIPIFSGYIESAKKDVDKGYLELKCFDLLTFVGSTEAYEIYKKAFKESPKASGGKITLKDFRDYFTEQFGIEQVDTTLANDQLIIKQNSHNKDMTVLDVLKHICQINGCFGIMRKDGKLDYKYFRTDLKLPASYPSNIYPGQSYPGQATEIIPVHIEALPYYRKFTNDNAIIQPLAVGLKIRTNENDSGVVADGTTVDEPDWTDDTYDKYLVEDSDNVIPSSYTIQGNMFAYKLSNEKRSALATNIVRRVGKNFTLKDYSATCNGLPYVECGDAVSFTNSKGKESSYIVTNRELNGIQALKDTFSCDMVSNYTVAEDKIKPGGYVSDLEDESQEQEIVDTVASAISDEEVMIVVSWDASTGILETTSKRLSMDSEETNGESSET